MNNHKPPKTDHSRRGKPMVAFFLLTFLISWTLWSPFYFIPDLSEFWALPGAWGPTLAALILTWRQGGRKAVRALIAKAGIWKVPFRYYAFAILGVLGVGLVSLGVYRIYTGGFPDMSVVLEGMGLEAGSWGLALALFPLFYLINTLLGGPIAEELGWRGYAQGGLQARMHPNLAGALIGFLWSLWHLPFFYLMPQAVGHMPLLPYIASLTAMGVIFSWLYNRTRGSVLLAILLHGGMNFAEGFLGADLLADRTLLAIHLTLMVVLAGFLGWRNRRPVAENP